MNKRPESGPHHSDDTEGGILVELIAKMLPHDSPEFIERVKKGRPPGSPPIPDYLKNASKLDDGSKLPTT